MIDYQETIDQLESEIVAIGSILPDASELTREAMQDAITLLKHYREGLDKAANRIEKLAFQMPAPNEYTPQFVLLAVELRQYARKEQTGLDGMHTRG